MILMCLDLSFKYILSMESISLAYLDKYGPLKSGYVILRGSTGIKYKNRALYVPNYGWVPCSIKLKNNFTCDPKKLMLVIEEPDDDENHTTSKIWITLNNIVRTLGTNLLK